MIRAVAKQALASPLIWPFLHRRAQNARSVTILCYHTLGPNSGGANAWTVLRQQDFLAQLEIIRENYDIVSLDQALEAELSARPRVVLTFDDGDIGLSDYLLPVLKESPFPVTIYVATKQIMTGQPFWFDRVMNALQAVTEIEVDELGHWKLPSGDEKARWTGIAEVLEALKASDPSARDELADKIVSQCQASQGAKLGPMSQQQLAALASLPGVTIGAHSHGHELLDQISAPDARQSILQSRELLKEWTGQEIRHFAYPNGNHTASIRQLVEELGFASAVALTPVGSGDQLDRFALPRISIGRFDDISRFRLRLADI